MGVSPLAELSLMLVDVKHMERLHEVYMGEPGPTDVLAFPQDDLDSGAPVTGSDDVPEALLGDVVLCPQVAERQALAAGHSPDAGAAPAVHARDLAPARLRPRRAGGGAGDGRGADPAAGRLAGAPQHLFVSMAGRP